MLKIFPSRGFAWLIAAFVFAALTGCSKLRVLSPSGDIASQQRDLVIVSTLLMLLVIVPVMFLIFYFAWKYRETNTEAEYAPGWFHSTMLELVIWTIPLLIIITLGAITWITTYKLDPYRPLDRIDAHRALPADVKPLEVQVVSLDWKWLFFYPEQGIATVNEVAAPVDRPIRFKLTSSSTMNAFYIPELAGMIYSMPGMQTELNAVINKPGVFHGLGSHYSGSGFAGMTFSFHGLSNEGFDQWVAKARAEGTDLNRSTYVQLAKPSERNPVQRFANVDPQLFERVVNRCVETDQLCVREIMAIDARGGEAYVKAMGLNLPLDICKPESGLLVLAPESTREPPLNATTTLQ